MSCMMPNVLSGTWRLNNTKTQTQTHLILLPVTVQKMYRYLGLNSIYFETIEKQYKYYTNLACQIRKGILWSRSGMV